ncbi:MAG: phosphomannose isomerase type II C-terminal cupin domain [bacterium]
MMQNIIISEIKEKNFVKDDGSSIGERPWGRYEVLIEQERYKVKKISVLPNSRLSLQSHLHRSEHWVVVRGVAKVHVGGNDLVLNENESTFIPAGAVHRLENIGKIDLEIIEVQTGSYVGEDDITRYEDDYDRIAILEK